MRLLPALALLLSGVVLAQDRPNIVYVYADDLGYGELGCYGQTKIRTPHLDALAARGLRFTQHYAGSAVCAPSRCVLMTGKDTGHAAIRGNSPWASRENPLGEGQEPLPGAEVTLAELLQGAGYRTGCVGKWGLGGPGTEGAPTAQGFDFFFGYLCQKEAHSYYPAHLWRGDEKVAVNAAPVPGSARIDAPTGDWSRWVGEVYAPDLMVREAEGFIARAAEDGEPFFLWYATPIPHAALHAPADAVAEYADELEDEPYLGQSGYTPHPTPRAAYAAMISELDRNVGRLVAQLAAAGVLEDTLVIFSSDNGATFNGGVDAKYFDSVGGLRGLKGSLFEGGLRVPMIAAWPGHVPAGAETAHVSGQVDVLPTVCALLGIEVAEGLQGESFAPLLTGAEQPPRAAPLYWELGRAQALRRGDWKVVRTFDAGGRAKVRLFDLGADPREKQDLAAAQPERLAELLAALDAWRVTPQIERFRRAEFGDG